MCNTGLIQRDAVNYNPESVLRSGSLLLVQPDTDIINFAMENYIQVDEVRQVPIFADMSSESVGILAKILKRRSFPKDALMIQQAETGNSMFFIANGKVKVVMFGEDGREVILSSLRDGDFFGEMSLIDGQPRSASVVATEDTTLFELPRDGFLQALRLQSELMVKIMLEMSRRLRVADQNIKSLALLDVYGRVARALRILCRDEGQQAGSNVIIEKRPPHQDLAAMAGTSRETVSRVLGDLIRAGFLSLDGKRLIVHDEFLEDSDSLD